MPRFLFAFIVMILAVSHPSAHADDQGGPKDTEQDQADNEAAETIASIHRLVRPHEWFDLYNPATAGDGETPSFVVIGDEESEFEGELGDEIKGKAIGRIGTSSQIEGAGQDAFAVLQNFVDAAIHQLILFYGSDAKIIHDAMATMLSAEGAPTNVDIKSGAETLWEPRLLAERWQARPVQHGRLYRNDPEPERVFWGINLRHPKGPLTGEQAILDANPQLLTNVIGGVMPKELRKTGLRPQLTIGPHAQAWSGTYHEVAAFYRRASDLGDSWELDDISSGRTWQRSIIYHPQASNWLAITFEGGGFSAQFGDPTQPLTNHDLDQLSINVTATSRNTLPQCSRTCFQYAANFKFALERFGLGETGNVYLVPKWVDLGQFPVDDDTGRLKSGRLLNISQKLHITPAMKPLMKPVWKGFPEHLPDGRVGLRFKLHSIGHGGEGKRW